MSARCRSCQAPVVWANTVNDRRMPVDAEPSPDGNIVLDDLGDDRLTPLAIVVDPGEPMLGDPPRYMSHYATCPDAERWRKR